MVLYFILFVIFAVMTFFYMKFKNFLKAFLIGSMSGLVFMGGAGYFFPDYIKFNVFTILFSVIVGIPGVVMMALYNFFV